ncbi:hypothetical protein Pint_36235 [Pistacia integerrima]|uniref:Uncharacterized protein n=1 Tax=Pistacia integerrima TaxID=434235 RepID=A0ACC0XYQ8_9ROSI|nr:hypothetical protein Pint_36235 [Pistacia integerrima]
MNMSAKSSKLQGPRPAALKVSKSSSKIMTKKKNNNNNVQRVKSPVVIYLVSPKIIHVRPEEFMGLVQRLTGKQATENSNSNSESSCATVMENGNKCVNGGVNYEDEVAFSANLAAAYPSLCIDIYADWDNF